MKNKLNKFSNLEDFIENYLRKFKKSAILDEGLKELWENLTKASLYEEFYSRIILLSLATGNNYRDKKVENFEQICKEYIEIDEPKVIANELIQEIKNFNDKDEKIPENFLKEEIIQEALETLVFRNYNLWLKKSDVSVKSLYTSWKLFLDYEKYCPEKDCLNAIAKNTIQMEPIAFMRSCFALFSFAIQGKGLIQLDSAQYDEAYVKRMNIDKETCKLAADRLSIDENELRESWLKTEVLEKIQPYEQKFFPNPLAKQPLIHMNQEQKAKQLFIMPSPQYFLYAAQNYLCSILSENIEGFDAKFGEVIEEHICEALCKIFEKCEKIKEERGKKSADFKITLEKCILIIELKTRIAPLTERSIMGYRNIAKMWGTLYSACKQIVYSIKKCNDKQKRIIPIILFYDLFGLQYLSFSVFAKRSGLFEELGINYVEVFNWSQFEAMLSRISVDKFEEELLERISKADSLKIEEIINFDPKSDKDNLPTHSYEYLQGYENSLRGKS